MLLTEYQWSGNPRGMHNSMVFRGPTIDLCRRWQLGWYKLNAARDEFLGDTQALLIHNITPILRIFRPSPGAMPVDAELTRLWRAYAGVGMKWFEFYNEPNLIFEWPPIENFNPRNPELIRPLMENWLVFADTIISLGGYPAFPALAESVDVNQGSIMWMDAMLLYLAENHRDRFIQIINNGLWFAVHPYLYNHFYQALEGQPNIPRDPTQVNGEEGNWRFEYPYDPICQTTDPGRTVFGGTRLTPYGDPNGLCAMGIAWHYRLAQWFDAGVTPVVGTEGGIWPNPRPGERLQPDIRYPWYDTHAHGEGTVAMFNWLTTAEAPPWHFGVTLWKEDEYFELALPALPRMEQVAQQRKVVPPLSSSTPGSANSFGRGPGPIRGQPTYHVVLLAPGLTPEWFFESARAYWNTFRPIVATTWDYLPAIPSDRSLAMTVISPPDVADGLREVIQKRFPNVLFDLLLTNGDPQQVAETLNSRVWSNRRYG